MCHHMNYKIAVVRGVHAGSRSTCRKGMKLSTAFNIVHVRHGEEGMVTAADGFSPPWTF